MSKGSKADPNIYKDIIDVGLNDAADITTLDSTQFEDHCELCQRNGLKLTRHHLIPRSRHNKVRTKRHFSRDAMVEEIAMLCRPCHSQIHRTFSNHELAEYYHNIERLKDHTDMAKFITWIKKRPAGLRVRVRR